MKCSCFLISIFSFLWLDCCKSSEAEVTCSSEVSYRWSKAAAALPSAQETKGSAQADPKAAPADSNSEPSVVRFGTVSRSGADEATAKERLNEEVGRLKARASDTCRREHEAVGNCVATKFSAKATLLSSLGFSARNELEKALMEECRDQQGVCLGVVSSDPQCKEKITAQPTAAAGGDGKEGKEKKKK